MKPIDIIIETPKGSAEKYTLDKKSGRFKLKKILPTGMIFPFDFGIIPGTIGEDQDPLDALVVSEFKSFPGCVIECRLIGALLAEQTEKGKTIRNDRFFFVPVLSKQFKEINAINDLPEEQQAETENFFVMYNKTSGKEFKILEVVNASKAIKLINQQG